MNIAINGYFLTRPGTGFDTYARGLLDAFGLIAPRDRFKIYVPWAVDYQPQNNHEIVVIPPVKWLGKSLQKYWWEQWQLPSRVKKNQVDLLHHFYPVYALLFPEIKQIISVHDAIPWELARDYQYSISGKILRWFIKFSLRKANQIITISNASKAALEKYLKLNPAKIKVIYNGIDERYRLPLTNEQITAVLTKYALKPPYILYVGGFDKRKNVRRLVEAFASITNQIPQRLVLPGQPGPQKKLNQDYYDLPELIKKFALEDRIILPGWLTVDELRVLYHGADLFIMPSKVEGFNLNVIEALACGTPVIAAKTSSTGEILGYGRLDAPAFFIDPNLTEKYATAILKILGNTRLRHELIARGRHWQLRYNWKTSAADLLEIYRQTDK